MKLMHLLVEGPDFGLYFGPFGQELPIYSDWHVKQPATICCGFICRLGAGRCAFDELKIIHLKLCFRQVGIQLYGDLSL